MDEGESIASLDAFAERHGPGTLCSDVLSQPLAAKEISAGVAKAGGSITCDHIVRALGVCDKSARLEVTRGMAPYVSDLEHEETIQGLFESSYEREQVDRALNAYSNQSI